MGIYTYGTFFPNFKPTPYCPEVCLGIGRQATSIGYCYRYVLRSLVLNTFPVSTSVTVTQICCVVVMLVDPGNGPTNRTLST